MTVKSNSFEGGTNGTTIDPTSSLVGGAAITVYNNGGGVAQFSNTRAMHGSLCAHLSGVNGTGNITAFLPTVSATAYAWRGYFWIPTGTVTSGNEVRPLQLQDTNGGQALLVRRTGSALAVRGASSTDVWTSSTPGTVFPEGQWVRVEVLANINTGAMSFATYAGDSTTALFSQSMSSAWGYASGASAIQRANFGFIGNSVGDIYVDDVSQNDAGSAFLGPALAAPNLSLGLNDRLAQIVASTTSGTSPYTYAITQTAGTATSAASDGTGKWLVAKHPSDTLTYQVTVTDANNVTSNQTVDIPPYTTASSTSAILRPSGTIPGSTWA